MLTMHRPAIIDRKDESALDDEFRSARWAHHRLLDFEQAHQVELDRVAEIVAPGVVRVGRILSRLARRSRRAARATSGTWCPNPHPQLQMALRGRLAALREQRNADPRWQNALKWADEQVGAPKQVRRRRAKDPSKVKRRKGETDEAWAKRFALLTTDETDDHFAQKLAKVPRDTRRDVNRKALYRERRIYWGTWNGLLGQVDQARKAVLQRRKQGLPAEWKRPRWSDDGTLYAEPGGFRVVERGKPWWVIEIRVGTGERWVRFRAKCGNWHAIPEGAKLATCELTRRRDGERWKHSVSIAVDTEKRMDEFATRGTVAFDWGHREHGHDRAAEGIRAFTWLGDDGESGEVLIPAECRKLLDDIDAMKASLDELYNARKKAMGLRDRNRYTYRLRLMRSGARSAEEANWLRWDMRRERRIVRARKRLLSLRKDTYLKAVRGLRKRYATFVFEGEENWSLKKLAKDEQIKRRKRSNRDLSARYEWVSMCERFGARIVTVRARNTTRECPECGNLDENGPELLVACSGCGVVRDKDMGAARVILRRGQEVLENEAA